MSYRTLDLNELSKELTDLRDKKQFHVDDASEPDLDDDEKERLAELTKFADQFHPDLESYARDESTLIADDGFEAYAEEQAEEIGAIQRGASWPNNCIDWERAASELQQDYTSYEFDGETWWGRS